MYVDECDERCNEQKYVILRFFKDDRKITKIVKRNLTLAQAQAHCNDPSTRVEGVYFDGYVKQERVT